MGGVDNNTSRELTGAKQRSRKYHAKINEQLYKEYMESDKQFSQTFLDWKREKLQPDKPKEEPTQRPWTKKELRAMKKQARAMRLRVKPR